jgi:anaphase-promoting complex subunit 1
LAFSYYLWYVLVSITLYCDLSRYHTEHARLDDRIPVWPPDLSAVLYGRISSPDWKVQWHDLQHIVMRFQITPSLEYGICDPLQQLHELSLLFNTISDSKVPESEKRAENAIFKMITHLLPLGISAPLREAARTCQLVPPGNWPLDAYRAIGRNDLAASATQNPDMFYSDGYRSRRDFIVSLQEKLTWDKSVTHEVILETTQGSRNDWRNYCGISRVGWR